MKTSNFLKSVLALSFAIAVVTTAANAYVLDQNNVVSVDKSKVKRPGSQQ